MYHVSVEFVFPLSCAVDVKNSNQITLNEEVIPGETIWGLLMILGWRYPDLYQTLFDLDKKELSPYVLMILNDHVLDHTDIPITKLSDGDRICILPVYMGG